MADQRSRQAQLQRIVGSRGVVETWVGIADFEHPAIGWYITVREDRSGCECQFCVARRQDRSAFVAGNAFLAAGLLHAYVTSHPHANELATD